MPLDSSVLAAEAGSAGPLPFKLTFSPSLAYARRMDEQARIELEAAAFRGLVAHLQKRTDVQNIDLMNLAGFCRNCLSKWYLAEAKAKGVAMDYDGARKKIYGMSYEAWKSTHQLPASDEQKQKFQDTKQDHAVIEGLK